MCDCYGHTCLVCQHQIEMHLGDYNTSRDEVAVFHKECFKHIIPPKNKGIAVWKSSNENSKYPQTIVVVALTKNAANNHGVNYPNEYNVECLNWAVDVKDIKSWKSLK